MRIYTPIYKKEVIVTRLPSKVHPEVDLTGGFKAPRYAFKDGVVTRLETGYSIGKIYYPNSPWYELLYDDGYKDREFHNSKVVLKKVGQRVKSGELVAYEGNTGYVLTWDAKKNIYRKPTKEELARGVGSHTHIKIVDKKGKIINPLDYIVTKKPNMTTPIVITKPSEDWQRKYNELIKTTEDELKNIKLELEAQKADKEKLLQEVESKDTKIEELEHKLLEHIEAGQVIGVDIDSYKPQIDFATDVILETLESKPILNPFKWWGNLVDKYVGFSDTLKSWLKFDLLFIIAANIVNVVTELNIPLEYLNVALILAGAIKNVITKSYDKNGDGKLDDQDKF